MLFYEKNIPTQQEKTSENMRLSQTNENRQRAPSDQSPPSRRPQETLRLKRSFSKGDFRRVRKYGKRFSGVSVHLDVLSENFNCKKLGMTVSRKFGKAVARNKFKRRVREAFRKTSFPAGVALHVTPKKDGFVPTLSQILEDFNLL